MPTKPSYKSKIVSAIASLGTRGGSSFAAIKKALKAEPKQFRFINAALNKGIQDGTFIQVVGKYKVTKTVKKKKVAKKKVAKKKVVKKKVAKKKVAKKKVAKNKKKNKKVGDCEATLYFNVCVSDVLDDMGAGAREPIRDGLLRSGFPFYIEDCSSSSDEHDRRACETLPIEHLSPDGLKMTAKELQTYLACCEASYETGEMPECYDWWDVDKFDAFQTKVIKEATKAYAFLSKSMAEGKRHLLKVALGKPKTVIKKKVKR